MKLYRLFGLKRFTCGVEFNGKIASFYRRSYFNKLSELECYLKYNYNAYGECNVYDRETQTLLQGKDVVEKYIKQLKKGEK